MFHLYDEDGWINILEIAKLKKWLNVIIGPRQVGKTYGTLKLMLDEDLYFLYMRRTIKEFEMMEHDPDLNPFLKMEREGYHVDIVTKGKNRLIGHVDVNEEKTKITRKIASGMTLEEVASVRGFSGDRFSDLVFDEFIPEHIVRKRQGEGVAFLNAYVTINGNRELEGRPPLRCWLLANSNDLTSPILSELGLTGEVERLIRTGKEYTIKDGFFLALTKSEKIIEKRKDTALMKHLKGKGRFYEMAMENQFAYNDLSQIQSMSNKGMKCLFQFGNIYVYDNGEIYYCCRIRGNTRRVYDNTSSGSRKCQLEFPYIRAMYAVGYVRFDSMATMSEFKNFFKIND